MKSFVAGFLMALVCLPLCGVAIFAVGFADVHADTAPPAWERWLMDLAVHQSVQRHAENISMPSSTSEERFVKGGKLYMNGCAGCHGELGKPFGADPEHYPAAPQLPHVGTKYSEAEIRWVVKHGIRMTAMSAYGRFYSEEELQSIAAFVGHIRTLPADARNKIFSKP